VRAKRLSHPSGKKEITAACRRCVTGGVFILHVLVKGAGVAGLTVAYELAVAGADVTVIDQKPTLAGSASWFAGGMLAPYCERENAEETVVTLGLAAADWWEKAVPGTVTFAGTLVVAPRRDTGELERFATRTRNFARVDAAEIAALEPDLGGRFDAGLFFAEEGHLDPRQALLRLHDRLVARGVAFHFGRSEPPAGYQADVVVDCTGMAAADAQPDLRGVRGEMLYLQTSDLQLSRPVRLIHPRIPVYVVPRGDGRFMVGATMIESDSDAPVTARSLMELLNAAYTLHPAFGEARVVEISSGVRPAYPDNLPKVMRKSDTIFVNGFYRHGFLLAPAIARQAAEAVFADAGYKENEHETDRQRRDG
jgi:glycine oxidase